jgi:hypothetical protein
LKLYIRPRIFSSELNNVYPQVKTGHKTVSNSKMRNFLQIENLEGLRGDLLYRTSHNSARGRKIGADIVTNNHLWMKTKKGPDRYIDQTLLYSVEAASRFELENVGFADRCLTTWLCRPYKKKMERETGFEPATSTLARSHSTTELFPLSKAIYLAFSSNLVNRKQINFSAVF